MVEIIIVHLLLATARDSLPTPEPLTNESILFTGAL